MPAVSTVSPTSNVYINGVLSGTGWAVNSLTYSFPTDLTLYGPNYGAGETTHNFGAFTAIQQKAVHSILDMVSTVVNLTFTEVTETSAQHGDLRYAESDSPGTAWTYFPTTAAVGGDSWYENSTHAYDNPIPGNYAYLTMVHETGHALGLKHPQDVIGSFGTMPTAYDSLEYTVMSYRSYIGASTTGGWTNGSTSYPQTLMMYDIAALQTMYGANYTTYSGDTVYSWSPTTGERFIDGVGQGAPAGNKIFMTVWDGGGNDTYDFSNFSTNLSVNLNPGGWTTVSATQLADLGNGHLATGNIANALLFNNNPASLIENAIGGSGNDTLIGNIADNRLTGGHGNDYLDGGDGTDTAVYSGQFANFTWAKNVDATWSITDLRAGSPDGTDTLKNIELLQFTDGVVTIGTLPIATANHAPTITSPAQSALLTEWTDLSANEIANTSHLASGSIIFTDPDASDTHTATFAPQGTGYLGTFSLNTSNIDGTDSVGWSFAVSDSAIDYLTSGQMLTQLYNVIVNDGHGGSANQVVAIQLIGSSDATTRTSPSNRTTKKSGAPDSTVDDHGAADSTPAALNSHSDQGGMANDMAPASADSVVVVGVAQFDPHPLHL